MTPEQIKQWRIEHKLSQKQAAAYVDCALRSWQRYESGERHPDGAVIKLLKIAEEKHFIEAPTINYKDFP